VKYLFIIVFFAASMCAQAQFSVISKRAISLDFKNLIEKELIDFYNRYPSSVEDTITIYLAYSRREFDEMTQGTVPDWGIGAADPENNRVVLFIVDFEKSSGTMRLLRHELAHIFLHRSIGEVGIPRWFDEGFAQWAAGPVEFSQASKLAFAVMFGGIIPLSELDEMNLWDSEKAQLAYAESYSAFDALLKITPGNYPSVLFDAIKKSGNFEDGVYSATGITNVQFYLYWRNEVAKKYNIIMIFADWRYLFALLTLVFILFGCIKLYRIGKRKRNEIYENDQTEN